MRLDEKVLLLEQRERPSMLTKPEYHTAAYVHFGHIPDSDILHEVRFFYISILKRGGP